MAKKSNLTPNALLTCILYAVIGALLIIMKSGSLDILMTIIGALFIVAGIIDIFKSKDVVRGIVEIVIGAVILIAGWTITDLVLLIFGILLVIKGALDLFKSFKSGFMAILASVVTIVLGVLLIVARWTIIDTVCIIAGVVFIVNAVLVLLGKAR